MHLFKSVILTNSLDICACCKLPGPNITQFIFDMLYINPASDEAGKTSNSFSSANSINLSA